MNLQTIFPSTERSAFRTAFTYAAAAFLWLAVIEIAIDFFFKHKSLAEDLTEDHEWVFILASFVIVYFSVHAQISRRLRENRELLKLERDYNYVVTAVQEGICALDAEGKVRYFNSRMSEMLGYTMEEAVGRSMFDFAHEDAKAAVAEHAKRRREGISGQYEATLRKKDGASVDAMITASPMMSDGGHQFEGTMVIVIDMTERKRIEKELKEYETRFRRMLDNIRLMAMLMDLDGNVTFVNDFLLETTGYGREEVIGRNWFDLFIPEKSRDEIRRVFSTFMRSDKETHTRYESSIRIKNDEPRRISWCNTLLRDRNGKPIGLTAIGEDVTEKKRAEEAILESEQKYRSLFETASDAIFVADAETGILIDVNAQGEKLIGKGREEIIGEHQTTLHPPEEATAHSAEFKAHVAGGKNLSPNIPVRHKDGREIPVDIRSGHFRMGGREIIFGIFHDMTDRKKAEGALRRKTELTSLLQDISVAANEATSVNDAMLICLKEICGYTGWEIGHVYFLGSDRVLRSTPIWSLREGEYEEFRQVTELTTFVSGAGLPGRALSTGRPAWILDVTCDINFYRTESLKSLGMKSGFAFPVLVRKEVVAVMEFFTKQMEEPDEHLLEAINSLTVQMGRVVERKRLEERLQLTHRIIESAVEGVVITDPDGVIISVNPAFSRITGYEAEVIGEKTNILKSGRHDDEFYKGMWASLIATGNWEGEIWNRRKNGEIYPEWLSITAVKDFAGRTTQYAAMFSDISEYKRSQQEVEYQAYHDALTGLPNRTLFMDRLKQAVVRARRNRKMVAVIFLDLDNFKQINDSMGHPTGDLLLKGMAVRLICSLRESDTASRFGGDEFAVFLEDIANDYEIVETARRIVDGLTEPYHLKEHGDLIVSSSAGITVFPQDGDDVTELLKNADMAMYHAKESGKNNYQFFTKALNEKLSARLVLETKLKKAIERRELLLHYQPKVSILTGRMTGMEALLRWRQPDGTLIPPSTFIPLAEETGLIVTLDDWALRTACAFTKRIHDTIPPILNLAVNVSVNLSARDLERLDIVESISAVVTETGLSPEILELELTESAIIKNLDMAVGTLRDLRDRGFNISIDDFGTGYSSLNYITKLPINVLKLDRSLIIDLPMNPNARSVARAITSMAHDLGVKIVAEGVETREQLDFLCSIRCNEIQGYLFSKPLPEDEFENLLRENRDFLRG